MSTGPQPSEQLSTQSQTPEPGSNPNIGDSCTAQVKWFDPAKGFGFLTMGEGSTDIFVHQRDLNASTRSLNAGDTVNFTYTIENGKPKAKEVTNPNLSNPAQSGEHSSLTNPEFAARLQANPEIKLARVKWWDMKKGYGFLTPIDNSQDVFVHQSEIKSTAFRALHEGSDVEFKSFVEYQKDGKEQLKAREVTGPGGAAIVPPDANGANALNQMAALTAMGMVPLLPSFASSLGRKTGTVKWYDEKKGYGFVITADNAEFFCHSSSIQSAPGQEASLQQGQIVEFSTEIKDGKPRTVNVTGPRGAPVGDGGFGGLGKRKGMDGAAAFGFMGGYDVNQQQQFLQQQQLLLQQQMQHQGYYGAEQFAGAGNGAANYGNWGMQAEGGGTSASAAQAATYGYQQQQYPSTQFYPPQ